jgi:hypothetical protein
MKSRSRRTFLASSASVALLKPFIDCIEARAAAPSLKPCFVSMFKAQIQYGGGSPDQPSVTVGNWVPTMAAGKLKMSPILAPFEAVKDYMTFVVGLDVATGPSNWHHCIPGLFSGSKLAGDNSPARSETLDYYVARRMGGGVDPLVLNPYFENGYSEQKTQDHASWYRSADGSIVRKRPISNPLAAFTEVFGQGGVVMPQGDPADAARQQAAYDAAVVRSRKSILDAVRADANRVRSGLTSEHKIQIDAALGGLREVEVKFVGKNGRPSPELQAQCSVPARPSAMGKSLDNEANMRRCMEGLVDVALASMRCGLRPVVSLQFLDHHCQEYRTSRIRSEFTSEVDGDTPYHFEYSHHPSGTPYIKHEAYVHSYYARLLSGMKDIPAGATNLLEKSIGLYMTTMSHNHSNNGHSFFVVGNGGGKLKSNRILTFGDPLTRQPTGKPHNDLLVSVLQAFGYSDVTSFGDPQLCKGGLPGFL